MKAATQNKLFKILALLLLSAPVQQAVATVGTCSIPSLGQFSGGQLEFCDGSTWNSMKGPAAGACATAGQVAVTGSDYIYCDGSNWWSMKGPVLGTCSNPGLLGWNGSVQTVCISGTLYAANNNTSLIQAASQAVNGRGAYPRELADFLALLNQGLMGYQDLVNAMQTGSLPSVFSNDGLTKDMVLAMAQGLASCQPAGEWSTCTIAINATASNTYQNYVPSNTLIDGSGGWNSGGGVPQWIEYDLGTAQTLNGMNLSVLQEPAGVTTHEIFAGPSPNPTNLIGVLYGSTTNGQTLSLPLPAPVYNVRYVRVLTTKSPAWVGWGRVQFALNNTPDPNPSHTVVPLMWGYFDAAGVGPGDAVEQVHAAGSNIAWVGYLPTVSAAKGVIEKAANLGMPSVLNVQSTFFPGAKLDPNFQSDFQSYWSSFGADQKNVTAFYLFDEPFNANATSPSPIDPYLLRIQLEQATAAIHVIAPNRPVIVVHSFPEVRDSSFASHFPLGIDIIGEDCYLAFESACTTTAISSDIQKLLSLKQPVQKMIFIMDSFWVGGAPTTDIDNQLVARNQWWQQVIAQNFSQTAAIVPFLYTSFQDNTGANNYGAQSFPNTMAWIQSYFGTLKNGGH
jgi:hypothetical protein